MGKLLKKIPMEDIPDGYYMIHWTKEGSILRNAVNAVIDAWNEEYAQSEKHIQEPTVPTQAPEEPAILTRWIDPTIGQQEQEIKRLNNIRNKAIEYIWSTKYEWGDLDEDNESFDIDAYELLKILEGSDK